MDSDEMLTTTRAVRRRLDLQRPVARGLLLECLEIALQAPNGSNRQDWRFLLIEDPVVKQALADLYRRAWAELYPSDRSPRTEQGRRMAGSAHFLAAHLHEVPWLLLPLRLGRPPEGWRQAGFWGGILPAFWSFMLAARSRGLGTAWTTAHLVYEREAAELLGIPFDAVTQVGLSPVAHFRGAGFRPAARIPAEHVVQWDRWTTETNGV